MTLARSLRRYGIFVVASLALLWWIGGEIAGRGPTGGTELTAHFGDIAGLVEGDDVRLGGFPVGRVKDIQVVEGEAVVSFGVEDDVELPVDSTVAVRWRNLIGQRYLSVVPGTAAEPLEDGDEVDRAEDVVDLGRVVNQLSPLAQAIGPDQVNRIPAARTSTGVAYGTLFDAAEELLVSVDRDDLRTLTSELGTSLRGQGDELRRILRNTTDTASAFAERKDELDQLAGELTALTRLLADKSTTIADGTDDVSALVGSLASSADDIDTLLARTPSVASRLDELLVDAYGDLRCTAAGAASISAVIDTEHTLRQLTRLLRSAETAAVVIPKAIFDGPDGRYLSGTFGFAPGEFAEYPDFLQFAPTEDVAPCPDGAPEGPGGLVDAPVSSVSPDGDGADGEGDDAEDGDEDASRRLTSAEGPDDGGLGLLPGLVGALVVAAILTAAVAALRNRRKDLTP